MQKIEKLKDIILIILVSLSIILSYNLWLSSDSRSLLAFFNLDKIFSFTNKIDINTSNILVPQNIIVANGDGNYWKLNPNTNNFDKMWEITKKIIKDVNNSEKINVKELTKEEWQTLYLKRGIKIPFNYPLTEEILAIILEQEKGKINNYLINTEQIIITKQGTEEYLNLKNKDKCYSIKINNKNYDIEKEQSLIYTDKQLIKYVALKDTLPQEKISYEDLALIPVFTSIEKTKSKLKGIEITNEIELDDEKSIEKLVYNIFEGIDYAKFIQKNGTIMFISELNDVIKIYENGTIEFEIQGSSNKYIKELELNDAIKEILTKLNKIGDISNKYITNIEQDEEWYTIKFDYIVNDIKILNANEPYAKNPKNPAIVSINKKTGAIKCEILMIKYREVKDYNMLCENTQILNNIYEKTNYDNGKITIKDIEFVYVANEEKTRENVMIIKLPLWSIKYEIDGKEQADSISAVQIGGEI